LRALLEIQGLDVRIPLMIGALHPVRDVSFSVGRGETLCIVGESGCGKSLTSLAIMNLLPSRARRSANRLHFDGLDLNELRERDMADIRGDRMAMIFQEPMTSLNPAYTIGNQLEEALLCHRKVARAVARERAVYLLEKVGITAAGQRLKQYPHQLSGGLRQRVMIAMALMCGPGGDCMTRPVLEIRDVEKRFLLDSGLFRAKRVLHAVNGVSLAVEKGEILGLVGETGCGKSTLSRMMLGLMPATSGDILFDGLAVDKLDRSAMARPVQPVFQDPYSSLNPRKTVGAIIGLPLRVHGIGRSSERRAQVEEMMDRVGLARRHFGAYPNQLSGGQRQRVAIARALVMRPELIICDEPTSALDVSVQSQILNLLQDLQRELGLTLLLISHNLAIVQHMATRVAVMYLGRIVEEADTVSLFRSPRHPYTQALLTSILTPEPDLGAPETRLGCAFPNPLEPPSGCTFHPRCPNAMPVCSQSAPRPRAIDGGFG
jgi:peptide/nickel transport system ATP-binding protein